MFKNLQFFARIEKSLAIRIKVIDTNLREQLAATRLYFITVGIKARGTDRPGPKTTSNTQFK